MRTIAAGTALGPYTVESEVARGGMGAIYRARRRGDGALVALKVLDAGPSLTPIQYERFRREGELAARLSHPGIVRVHDAGVVPGACYLAMDLIDGAPLGESAGRLPPLEVARLVAQIARAVEYAHAHGVVHRDLKPSNVLVRREDGVALVTDFGIARDLTASALTKTGALVGTPTYLSPEQADGRPATSKSDVHALGAILFELLTGVPPFDQGELGALLVAISRERPRPPSALTPGVPRALDRVCLAALQKSPDARPDAGAFAADLEAIVAGRPEPHASRSRWIAIALAIALALGGGALLASRPAPSSTPPIEVREAPTATVAPPPSDPGPWVEPKWLRAVRARGDTATILEALDAIAASPPDARTRASAIGVLADLDARWREPDPIEPGRNDALDRLLWLQLLWKRLDPAHTPSPERAHVLTGTGMWAFSSGRGAPYMTRVGLAMVALSPDSLAGYFGYASGSDALPWTERDGELLGVGAELAAEKRDGVVWGVLAADRAEWLDQVREHGTTEQARSAARSALLELARSTLTVGPLNPQTGGHVLRLGANLATPDEATVFLDRADELLGGPSVRSLQLRADAMARGARDERARVDAARTADRALELVISEHPSHPEWAAETAVLAVRLWRGAGQTAGAVAALERAMKSGHHPGLAMRRVLLLVDLGVTEADLAAALADLIARLVAEQEATGRDDGLVAALADARATAAGPAAQVKERLGRWSDEELVRNLDPRWTGAPR